MLIFASDKDSAKVRFFYPSYYFSTVIMARVEIGGQRQSTTIKCLPRCIKSGFFLSTTILNMSTLDSMQVNCGTKPHNVSWVEYYFLASKINQIHSKGNSLYKLVLIAMTCLKCFEKFIFNLRPTKYCVVVVNHLALMTSTKPHSVS